MTARKQDTVIVEGNEVAIDVVNTRAKAVMDIKRLINKTGSYKI